VSPGCHDFTLQFAINLIAALVSPDTPALHARETFSEAYGPRLEPNSQPLIPDEEQRPVQIEY
jgi:hypothetical protein